MFVRMWYQNENILVCVYNVRRGIESQDFRSKENKIKKKNKNENHTHIRVYAQNTEQRTHIKVCGVDFDRQQKVEYGIKKRRRTFLLPIEHYIYERINTETILRLLCDVSFFIIFRAACKSFCRVFFSSFTIFKTKK